MDVFRLSPYSQKLSGAERKRYIAKLELIGHIDPFLLISSGGDSSATSCDLPAIDASDIVSYLVLQTSFISAQQFKARKSLEAYNQFVNGWVKDVRAWSCHEKVVITGKVSYIVKTKSICSSLIVHVCILLFPRCRSVILSDVVTRC